MDLGRVLSRVTGQSVSKDKGKDSFFLAVKLSSVSVLATVWQLDQGKVIIGDVGTGVLGGKDYAHLLKACDQAISQASIKTDPDVEKVIFAVPFGWVTDGKIVPEHLQTLRRICKELDLIPLGYVVTTEALENFYKEVEGAPLTAILIGVDEDGSTLTLYRAGKNLGTVPVVINSANFDGAAQAVEESLKRFPHVDVFPSRIILYNSGGDLESVAQKLTAHAWSKQLPFLHFPKVETAPADFVIKAVAAAGGLQMGASLDASELMPQSERLTQPSAPEQDIMPIGQPEEPSVPDSELEEVSPEEAGFVTESEFAEINIPYAKDEPSRSIYSTPQVERSPASVQTAKTMPKFNPAVFLTFFSHMPKILASLLAPLSGLFSPKPRSTTNQVAIPTAHKIPVKVPLTLAVILLAVAVIAAATIYFVPKANLLITVKAVNFNHDLTVGIATAGSSTQPQNIPGTFVQSSEIGTLKGQATGQKLVGDKAKGTVTIYSVAESKSFAANSVITATSGLKFTLDRDVTVASGDAVTPATASVGVHAADIGDKYNLPAGTKFTIGSLSSSDYLAKNDSAISGGSSHQATVVTKADQEKLQAALTDQLTSQAKTDLQAKVGSNQTLLPNAITSSVTKQKFSKNVDDEAESLSLDLTMDFKGVVFSKDDVVNLFSTQFSSEIPSGYALTSQNSQVNVDSAKTDKQGNAVLTVSLNANLAPQIDTSDIVAHSYGKSFSQAKNTIAKLPGVSTVDLQVKPTFFSSVINLFLPWKKGNLTAEVVSQ